MTRMFHVSSVHNRPSIQAHGLDWTRMSGTAGIAGSRRPEVEGIFLSPDHFTAQFFVRMSADRPVDIWAVDDVDPEDLVESDSGFSYLPYRIDRKRLTLHDQDLTADSLPPAVHIDSDTTAYRSSLTLTMDDGTVVDGEAAHAFLAQSPDPRPLRGG